MTKFELTNKHRHSPYSIVIELDPAIPQISRHLFTAKLASVPRHYPELEQFKQLIKHSKNINHSHPYTANKTRVLIYRLIFLSISFIFLTLGFLIFWKIGGWSLIFSPTSITAIKGILCSTCAVLFASSLMIALSLRNERETVLFYIHKARFLLKESYVRKRAGIGIQRFLGLGQQNAQLKSRYLEKREKIKNIKMLPSMCINFLAMDL